MLSQIQLKCLPTILIFLYEAIIELLTYVEVDMS